MKANNVNITMRALSSTVALIATRSEDNRGSMVINPQAQSPLRREIAQAAALGHILCDMTPVAVDGTWEHWPTAARARAFAAMLLLPDNGVRDVLAGRTSIDASDVRRVMDRFKTGPYATTYHLKNHGFIADEERRAEILRELAA
jgi:Zn-dependent peptidase ImmA (M78 family)